MARDINEIPAYRHLHSATQEGDNPTPDYARRLIRKAAESHGENLTTRLR